MPYTCHIETATAHTGSHSCATRIVVNLGIRRFQQAGQCPPKQQAVTEGARPCMMRITACQMLYCAISEQAPAEGYASGFS